MQLSFNCALSYLLMLCFKLFTWRKPTLRTGWCTVLCKRNESGCHRNLRISANKLWTFHSDEKAAKSWCIYCSNVNEISQAWWWTETKFRCMRRNFVSSFGRIETKFRLVKAIFRLAKRILVFQKFLNTIEYSCNHQLIAKVHVRTILINFLWFIKKMISSIATIVVEIENLRQNGAFYNSNGIF